MLKTASALALDNVWRQTFKSPDKLLNLPDSVPDDTQVVIQLYRNRPNQSSMFSWWWGSTLPNLTLSTETGEIVVANGEIGIEAVVYPGEYRLRGDVILAADNSVIPFLNGLLRIGNGMSQVDLRSLK